MVYCLHASKIYLVVNCFLQGSGDRWSKWGLLVNVGRFFGSHFCSRTKLHGRRCSILYWPTDYIYATGPLVNTTSFTVGNVKSTHYTFAAFNEGANITAKNLGDGVFSITNGKAGGRAIEATSWLVNAGFAPDKVQAGLYLPFYGRPNDHGELSLGGYDASRFTGQTTHFVADTKNLYDIWGFIPESVTCTIKGSTSSFLISGKTIIGVEPLYDFA
ncbi:hypothetical protein HDU76_012263 [Blyttiomyces sp. JEL0837]|nr:hypothetical protein HDU76_012263 [Blyttiomyces sp. JEL0837]